MIGNKKSAIDILRETSRTFFIPISRLSPGLKETVTAGYLCMRAIDEIEDHTELQSTIKIDLLRSIGNLLRNPFNENDFNQLFQPYITILPEVSLRLYEWAMLCPSSIAAKIWDATATMAEGMAKWVEKKWQVESVQDLDEYTYYVAGLVGVMLSDIWHWYDGTETDRELAIGFGRGLQAVNILRNRDEDLDRGVDFFPNGWEKPDMFTYARRNLTLADDYKNSIQTKTILEFCNIPLALAHGTLTSLEAGKTKLSRTAVFDIVKRVVGVT